SEALVRALHEQAPFTYKGARWGPGPEDIRALEARHGGDPPGGWRAVAALGCVLVADARGRRHEPLSLNLLDGWTRYMCPPDVLAALCIALGVPPHLGIQATERRLAPVLGGTAPALDTPTRLFLRWWDAWCLDLREALCTPRGATWGLREHLSDARRHFLVWSRAHPQLEALLLPRPPEALARFAQRFESRVLVSSCCG
ncbi:MAG: hypothetical protein KC492_34840, partial [Myxococcales bacterium]|nr:hypothetical protein [Myxococcales bacterium]